MAHGNGHAVARAPHYDDMTFPIVLDASRSVRTQPRLTPAAAMLGCGTGVPSVVSPGTRCRGSSARERLVLCLRDVRRSYRIREDNGGNRGTLALILQEEYIDESSPGEYVHVKSRRVTEWPVEFLSRPRRSERTIPDFLSPNALPNRLDIIRGKTVAP